MGLFSPSGVAAKMYISNGKFSLNGQQILDQRNEINELSVLYGLRNATVADDGSAVLFSVNHVSKKRWTGELQSSMGKWAASGSSMERVWRDLWERYFGSENVDALTNPKALLVVNGWFSPEGVREFGNKLKTWDSAVQEVELLDVEMKPTAVSACWSLEVSDQWVLRGYLNDYQPPRGLSFSLKGLEEAK